VYYFDPKDRETKELAPGVRTRTFWGENLLLSVLEMDPNSEVPSHTHSHEQGGIIIQGEVEMGIAGEAMTIGPGYVYVIPGDVEHWAKSGAQGAKVMDVFSPVREEFKY